jgi:predicted RNase H-like HicB family nuclease
MVNGGVSMAQVIAVVHEDSGVYGIAFPDFPGCVSGGKTLDEAMRRGRETLRAHVESVIEDGDKLPMLRSLDELKNDPTFRDDVVDGMVMALPFDLPGRAVRINISLEENLIDALDQAAKRAGMSRSAFIAEAAKAKLKV